MIQTTCKLDFGNGVARCALCERLLVKNVSVERRRADPRFKLQPIQICETCVSDAVAALHSMPEPLNAAAEGGAR